jgi:hypothetical protein
MMTVRLAVAAVIVLIALVVARWLGRRPRFGSPLTQVPGSVPIDDLGLPGGGLVVFVDPGCASCAAAVEEVRASGRPFVVVSAPDTRRRLGVRELPTTIDVGADGIVTRGWIGPLPPGVLRR